MRYVWMAGLILLWSGAGQALAHGVLASVNAGDALVVTVEYDDGEPAGYAGVKIYFSDEKVPFQTGRTDRNGRFLFQPDRDGEWKAIVNDGMGHRAVVKADVAPDNFGASKGKGNPLIFSKGQSVVTGLSLIFGICGLAAFYRGKKKV
ncbi:MAG: DUF4198 domain-containing protein [Desulfobacterales bacterium]|nr:DUF4198 domain-containing protein [Desulfobacterales bacterium]